MTDDEAKKLLEGEFDLDIPNFKKWNPDTRNTRSWIALAVDWYQDPRVVRLTLSQRAVWVQLVSMMGSRRGHLRGTTVAIVGQQTSIRTSEIRQTLLKLLKSGLIELRPIVAHNITNITNKTEEVASPPPPKGPMEYLTERARQHYVNLLGEQRFREEVEKAFHHWEAKERYPKPPFVTTFKNWVDRLPKKTNYEEVCK